MRQRTRPATGLHPWTAGFVQNTGVTRFNHVSMSHQASPARLSLEELGLFNLLAGVEKGENIDDAFLLQGLQARGFVTLGPPTALTPAGEAALRKLAARLEAESLGDTSVRAQSSSLDPHATRESPVLR